MVLIPVGELRRLDGYRRGDITQLVTLEGGRYAMNPSTWLGFRMQDGSWEKYAFADLQVTETELLGSTVHGWQIRIRLQDIGEVWAAHRRPALLAGLIVLGGVAFITLFIIFIIRGP